MEVNDTGAQPNRRPLNSRGSRWSVALTSLLLASSLSPNQISVGSVIAATVSAIAFITSGCAEAPAACGYLLISAAVFIQLRLLCNLLDGMVAIEGGRKSVLGEVYNDLPDRISDVLILVAAGYSVTAATVIPVSGPTLGWAAAVTAVTTAYVRVLGVSLGTPHFFAGPMAKPHRMAVLTAASLFGGIWLVTHPTADSRMAAMNVVAATLVFITIGGIITGVRRTRMIAVALQTSECR